MVRGRQPLEQEARSITLILTVPQLEALKSQAAKRRREQKRYISVSELVREAVRLYLAADVFFNR